MISWIISQHLGIVCYILTVLVTILRQSIMSKQELGGIPLSMKSKVLQDVTNEVDMPDMASLYHFSLNKWDNTAWNHEIVHLYQSKTIMHHDNASYLAQLCNNISALSYGCSTKVALQTPWVQSEECNSSLP
jgi:hypothetical protein